MSIAYLGVGANLDPEDNIRRGLQRLSQELEILNVSPCYQSAAVGFSGPEFLNLVLEVETSHTPEALNSLLKTIEFEFGRDASSSKYSSRYLDIDILLFDNLVKDFEGFCVPRQDVYRYAFVLKPLLDLVPEAQCPKTDRPLSAYAKAMAGQQITPFLLELP